MGYFAAFFGVCFFVLLLLAGYSNDKDARFDAFARQHCKCIKNTDGGFNEPNTVVYACDNGTTYVRREFKD